MQILHKVGVWNTCEWPKRTSDIKLHNALVNLYAQKNILSEHNQSMVSNAFLEKLILAKKQRERLKLLKKTFFHHDNPQVQKYLMCPVLAIHKQFHEKP